MPDSSFYYDAHIYRTQDAEVLLKWLFQQVQPQSILDVGCGIGTWLQVAKQHFGVSDILGIDGSPYDPKTFFLSPNEYRQADLTQPQKLDRKYDWSFCLEVGEHLPEGAAQILIDTLTAHSDKILFSAAIPGQGGHQHINEQWPGYWQQLFEQKGYQAFDAVRPIFWHDNSIACWYRQNMFIAAQPDTLPAYWRPVKGELLSLVHPEIYQYKLHTITEVAAAKYDAVF